MLIGTIPTYLKGSMRFPGELMAVLVVLTAIGAVLITWLERHRRNSAGAGNSPRPSGAVADRASERSRMAFGDEQALLARRERCRREISDINLTLAELQVLPGRPGGSRTHWECTPLVFRSSHTVR